MKKILIGAAVLAAITAASCSHKEAATAGDADTFAVSAATSDSVNTLFGTNFGSSLLAQYAGLDSAMKAEQPKADIIKGIQYALGAPEEKGVAVGMQIGLQILGNIQRMEEMGVKADRSAVLAAFKKAFLADSIDGATTGAAQMEYQALMSRIQQESKAFEDAKKANSPEALANVAEAEKYLKEAKAADPAIQTSESGLSYKIENAGDTAKITRPPCLRHRVRQQRRRTSFARRRCARLRRRSPDARQGRQGYSLHPRQPRLRCTGRPSGRHRPQRHAHLRHRSARRQPRPQVIRARAPYTEPQPLPGRGSVVYGTNIGIGFSVIRLNKIE